MRTEFTRAGLLGLVLAGVTLGQVGCDSYSTGHDSDPGGVVRLMRVMVQDSPPTVVNAVNAGGSTRGACTDLVDQDPPIACNENTPCKVLVAMEGGIADFTCRQNVCNDPFKPLPTGTPINPDTDADPMAMTPAIPGNSIRLVFDKLLDPSSIIDGDGKLLPGIVDFVDESRNYTYSQDELNGIWDPAGAPEFTSDPLLLPYGPAIQISPYRKPSGDGAGPTGLERNTKYTVIVHPGMIKDRKGNGLGDKNGHAVTSDVSYSFTTENVSANITVGSFVAVSPYQLPGDFTPTNGQVATMYASDVLELAFWADLDLSSFNFTITGPDGFVAKNVEAYLDAPVDPDLMCSTASTNQIDLAYTNGTKGMPDKWPVGTYTIKFTVDSTNDNTTTFDSRSWPGADSNGVLTFVVVPPPDDDSPATDLAIVDAHPLPEQQKACPSN
jgi:hypothetical protein